jgi:hypothetical protein
MRCNMRDCYFNNTRNECKYKEWAEMTNEPLKEIMLDSKGTCVFRKSMMIIPGKSEHFVKE